MLAKENLIYNSLSHKSENEKSLINHPMQSGHSNFSHSKDNLGNSAGSETGIVFAFGKLHSQQPTDSKLSENALFTTTNALLPLKFFLRDDFIISVACGDEHSVFVSNSGRAFVVGRNNMGQLGLDLPLTQTITRPTCIKSLKSDKVCKVGCGAQHTLLAVQSSDGKKRVLAFGINSDQQLGIGRNAGDMCSKPQTVLELESEDVVMLSGGRSHSAVVLSDLRLLVWGSGPEGQLGLGDQCIESDIPVQLNPPTGFAGFTAVSCGYYHTLAVTSPPALFACGESEDGKLGLVPQNSENYISELHRVELPENDIINISAGGSHSFAVTSKGHVYAMGSGTHGQLGVGVSISAQSSLTQPSLIKTFSDSGIVIKSVSAGESHSAFVTEDGRLFLCGNALHARLGFDFTANAFSPRLANLVDENNVSSTTSDQQSLYSVTAVACGGCHTVCLANKFSGLKTLGDTTNFTATSTILTASSARLGRRARRTAAQSLTMSIQQPNLPPLVPGISKSLSTLPPLGTGAPSLVSTIPTADFSPVSTMGSVAIPISQTASNAVQVPVVAVHATPKLEPIVPATAPAVLASTPDHVAVHSPPAPGLPAITHPVSPPAQTPTATTTETTAPQPAPTVTISSPPNLPSESTIAAQPPVAAATPETPPKVDIPDSSRTENSKPGDTTPKTPTKKSAVSLPLICGNKKNQPATPTPGSDGAAAQATTADASGATPSQPQAPADEAKPATEPVPPGAPSNTAKPGGTQSTTTKTCTIL